jgi:hypothetical protein
MWPESESIKPTVRAVIARGEREHRAIHRTSVVNYEHARHRDASGALHFNANRGGVYGEEDLDILLLPYSMLRSVFF